MHPLADRSTPSWFSVHMLKMEESSLTQSSSTLDPYTSFSTPNMASSKTRRRSRISLALTEVCSPSSTGGCSGPIWSGDVGGRGESEEV